MWTFRTASFSWIVLVAAASGDCLNDTVFKTARVAPVQTGEGPSYLIVASISLHGLGHTLRAREVLDRMVCTHAPANSSIAPGRVC